MAGSSRLASAQLQRQAFLQRAGEHARRIELLQTLEHRLDRRERATQARRDLLERLLQVSGIVHQIDQMQPGQALRPAGRSRWSCSTRWSRRLLG